MVTVDELADGITHLRESSLAPRSESAKHSVAELSPLSRPVAYFVLGSYGRPRSIASNSSRTDLTDDRTATFLMVDIRSGGTRISNSVSSPITPITSLGDRTRPRWIPTNRGISPALEQYFVKTHVLKRPTTICRTRISRRPSISRSRTAGCRRRSSTAWRTRVDCASGRRRTTSMTASVHCRDGDVQRSRERKASETNR